MWMVFLFVLPLLGMAYCCWHVWVLIPLARTWRLLIMGIGIVSFMMLLLSMGRFIDRMPLWIGRLCYDMGCSSLFVMLYLTMLFLLLDAGRLLHLVHREWLYQNFYTTAAIAGGMFILFLYGNINYHWKVREELQLTTSKQLERPLRIVMASDLHLGYHNPRKEFARWVDMINDEKPDVVLIAGDIVDMSIRPLVEERMAEEFRRLKAPVYACLGNHEYYTGEPLVQQFYRDAGICLLRDSCVAVGDLLVIGRDDRSNPHRQALGKIIANQRQALDTQFSILLDHQPYHLEQAERAGIDFQFSGHTHRGQVWPISWITDVIYECSFGAWKRGATRYYVSSGMGIWGGKFRLGTRSEYIVANVRYE